MISVPLQLRYCGRSVREPDAWFIPGDDPAVWLAELLRARVATASLELFVVPRSVRDRRPCGVLVVGDFSNPNKHQTDMQGAAHSCATRERGDSGVARSPTRQAGVTPAPTARMIAYGRAGDRLFMPADARLVPEFTANELREKLVGDVLVFHPSAGLVGFAASDAIRVADLLGRPRERETAWDRAQPGVAAPPRLIAVEPAVEISIQVVLEQGHDDIGSQSANGLPAAPNEPGNSPLHRAGRWMQEKFAKAMRAMTGGGESAARQREAASRREGGAAGRHRGGGALRRAGRWAGDKLGQSARWVAGLFTSGAPQQAGSPDSARRDMAGGPSDNLGAGWIANLQAWARQKLTAITAAMQAARHRELHRLTHLLDTNPDEALRYAMPMAGSRGVPTGRPARGSCTTIRTLTSPT